MTEKINIKFYSSILFSYLYSNVNISLQRLVLLSLNKTVLSFLIQLNWKNYLVMKNVFNFELLLR